MIDELTGKYLVLINEAEKREFERLRSKYGALQADILLRIRKVAAECTSNELVYGCDMPQEKKAKLLADEFPEFYQESKSNDPPNQESDK